MLSFLLLAAAVMGGVGLTYLFDDDASLLWRCFAGLVLGFTLESLFGYVAASSLGLGTVACVSALLVGVAPAAILFQKRVRVRLWSDARAVVADRGVALVSLLVLAWFAAILCARTYYETSAGIYTDDPNNYGDLGFHLAIASDFVYGQRFPPQHPSFGGAGLTYPFLLDFGAALLVAAGNTMEDAFFITAFIMFVCMVVILHRWVRLLTSNQFAATIAVLLFLLNGGLGWWLFFKDVHADGLMQTLTRLPREYTINPAPEAGLRWGNTVTTLLLSQRTLMLGISLAMMVFTLWWQAIRGAQEDMRRRLTAAGCIAGLLPLAHAHSFLVVFGMGICIALTFARTREAWRAWGMYFFWAVLIGLPQILWIMSNSRMKTSGFIGWQPGWDRGRQGPMRFTLKDISERCRFWLYNTGVLIPLWLIAFMERAPAAPPPLPVETRPKKGKRQRNATRRQPEIVDTFTAEDEHMLLRFCAPFALCFVVPNLFKLAPWVWDNIKVMIYWHISVVAMVGLLLARQWRERWPEAPAPPRGRGSAERLGAPAPRMGGLSVRLLAMALFVMLTLAGTLDVWRVLSGQQQDQIMDNAAVAYAAKVREVTPPNALILHAPVANHPLMLTGRRHLLGYAGHVWSQGFDPSGRDLDIRAVYTGAPNAAEVLKRYHVDYISLGPQERGTYQERGSCAVNDKFLSSMRCVLQDGQYSLYQVSPSP